MDELVLTIIGVDRPGLVELLSRTIAAHGGNWEASRMARMAGRFAGILRVTAPVERIDALRAACGALEASGLRVVVEGRAPSSDAPAPGLHVELVGNDRPGVVRAISAVLVEHQLNVEELVTDTIAAPMAGGTLLKIEATVRGPLAGGTEGLRRAIEAVAPDYMLELERLDEPTG
jgi:glycine cleavage system regulatory protein